MINERNCPVCGTSGVNARVFQQENINTARITDLSFASRKEPEYMCHRMVRCGCCGLVYVPAPPTQSSLAAAYHQADFDSEEEGNDAAAAYAKAILPVLERLPAKAAVLEIGTGTAAFLEKMATLGFSRLVGVEPSRAAIERAPSHRQAWIREGIFEASHFERDSFDLICCFMTLEHVLDPKELAAASMRLLKPGGALVTVTHDYRSWINRLLGSKSPIIDIEHMQLFSGSSIAQLFERTGYADVEWRTFRNSYSIRYWTRLAPMPSWIKPTIARFLSKGGLGRKKVAINVGNMMAFGFKPGEKK